jgi:DMSO/TMAO reductase YedYZ molybdopterin-dependent catalytic subunit
LTLLKDLRTPVFHAEGLPRIDPATWRLRVSGLVNEGRGFTLEEVKALPSMTVDARLTSVSGFSVRAAWDGVGFSDFLDRVKPLPSASHATFTSIGGYDSTLSFEDLLKPKVMLCYSVGGQPLELEYGGPVRLLVPHLWGYKSVKWLAEIEMTDRMKGGYWEDRGYSCEAEIEPGYTFDVNTRKRRPIRGGGEVTEF